MTVAKTVRSVVTIDSIGCDKNTVSYLFSFTWLNGLCVSPLYNGPMLNLPSRQKGVHSFSILSVEKYFFSIICKIM